MYLTSFFLHEMAIHIFITCFMIRGDASLQKKRDKALRMMFGSGGMVMVGKGN
jgi:hypothetical protein